MTVDQGSVGRVNGSEAEADWIDVEEDDIDTLRAGVAAMDELGLNGMARRLEAEISHAVERARKKERTAVAS